MAGTGYTNAYIPLAFPELADGCSVLIRNPQLMPPSMMQKAAGMAGDDAGLAGQAITEIMAYLIVAWRNVYAVDEDLSDLDLDGEGSIEDLMAQLESRERTPLGKPSPDTIPLMPMAIMMKVMEQVKDDTNPPQ